MTEEWCDLVDFCYNVFLTALVLGMCGAFGV